MSRAKGSWVSILVGALFLPGAPAFAGDTAAEARVHFDRALQLYEERYFDGALAELKKAYELKPSYKLLYNIGQVQLAMHDFAAALGSYREYLDKGGAEIPSLRRDMVEKEIKTLEQRVAKLTVEADVPNAEVFVDDISVGVIPLAEPVLVNSGTRRITVRHGDYLPQTRQLTVVGGSQEKVAFTFKAKVPSTSSSSGPSAREAAASPLPPATPSGNAGLSSEPGILPGGQKGAVDTGGAGRKVPWLTWTLTGAFAAGAAVVGVVTLSKNSSLSKERDTPGVAASQLQSDASDVRRMAIVTDGLIVAAVVTGALSVWLTLDSGSTKSHGSVDHENVEVGLGLSGVALRSRF